MSSDTRRIYENIDKLGKIYNPKSGRWVLRNGRIGKQILEDNIKKNLKNTKLKGLIENYLNIKKYIEVWDPTDENIHIGLFFLMNKFKNSACFVFNYNFETESIDDIQWYANKEELQTSSSLLEKLNYCINKDDIRFIIIPVSLFTETDAHANMVIIDKKAKSIHHYEPNGILKFETFKPQLLYKKLDNFFRTYFDFSKRNFFTRYIYGTTYKYYKPKDWCPAYGLQSIESELDVHPFFDVDGYCAIWSLFWLDIVLSNPEIPQDKLLLNLMNTLSYDSFLFREFINKYSQFIMNKKDGIFT